MYGIRLKKNGWVVVADGEKALFLTNTGTPDEPDLDVFRQVEQDNPPTHEQGVSRPGRMNDAGGHHKSAVQETDWHRLAKHEFAKEVAERLNKAALASRFDQLVLVAPPVVLGALRKELHDEASKRIVREIDKDLTKHPVAEIESMLFG
jgi:protein required for attachment to host cells